MKSSKAQIHSRSHKIPQVRFDARDLTSFAGVVVFLALFQALRLKHRLKACFGHLASTTYGYHVIMMLVVVHKLLGFRRLRGVDFYRDDPLMKHLLGLRKIPDVATISRHLKETDSKSFDRVLELIKEIVYQRIMVEGLTTLTIDFDGTVVWTRGAGTEGTAPGFNKQKKGARGYYPLMCTVAQTSQVLDMRHRPGNVHDSNGAAIFALQNILEIRNRVPHVRIESRCDSAFFSELFLGILNEFGVEFTISVPFERFPQLKQKIASRKRWRRLCGRWSYFEDCDWQPKKWENRYHYRFLFVRQKVAVQRRGPIQLDLFEPKSFDFDYKVIVTNKKTSAKNVLLFHNGRGSQEGIIGELKNEVHFDYIACRKQVANQHFMAAAVLAHNLSKELQMSATSPIRGQRFKRPAMWGFKKLHTLRRDILRRAGRVTRPGGELTIVMNDNRAVRRELKRYLVALAA